MFKKGWIRNWIVMLALTACSQPPVKDVVKPESKSVLPVKIAVIDSGFNTVTGTGIRLCAKGHYDYVLDRAEIGDDLTESEHGTNMARTIAKYAEGNYCLLIYKVINIASDGDANDIADAIYKARENGAQIINLSISTKNSDGFSTREFSSLWSAGEAGVKIFVAAGNNEQSLDKNCDVYPACYKRVKMTVVGSKKNTLDENKTNYGSKTVSRIENYCYDETCGTSVSTAIASGKTVKEINSGKEAK